MPKAVQQTGGVKRAASKPVPKLGGAWDRISDMEFDPDEGVSVCLYGNSGTGKTTFWATFPDPILAVICSGIQKPGELRSVYTAENRRRIKTVTLENADEMFEIVRGQQQTNTFRTIVLDHATGLQDLIIKEMLNLDETILQRTWGTLTRGQWGDVSTKTKELLRPFLNLGCHRIVVNQERVNEPSDESSEIVSANIGPALTGGAAGGLTPACDYVVQTFIRNKVISQTSQINGKPQTITKRTKEVEYCLRCGPGSGYSTKFRMPIGESGRVPEVIIDPTYDKMISVIRGE